jgi:hypothetical protein
MVNSNESLGAVAEILLNRKEEIPILTSLEERIAYARRSKGASDATPR